MRALALLFLVACGSTPPPPPKEPDPEPVKATRREPRGLPSVSQELGSIDPQAVEQTFSRLMPKLEACMKQGRGRLEYLAGDVKVFFRVDAGGKARRAFFEDTTLGDRDTERCILDAIASADWPKPQGGEAEVRNGFGFSPGGERPPTSWSPEKVTAALDDDRAAKNAIAACRTGVSGAFRLTAYVEMAEADDAPKPSGKPMPKQDPKHDAKHDAKKKPAEPPAPRGRFKAIGIAAPGKEAAEKVDCLLDAVKAAALPSPGSYPAKVTFTL